MGRTVRAGAVGDAMILVSSAEETDFRSIERAVGVRLACVTLPGFDDASRAGERLG